MSNAAIVSLFLDRYRADKLAGRTRSLESYQGLFPGFDDVIAVEFAKLRELESPSPIGSWTPAGAPRDAGAAGQRIGPFRIVRLVGRGGQGEVYLAEDGRLRRTVALKVLRGLGAYADEVLARFRREAELTSRLEHAGICPVHEAGIADGVAYIAMRYIRGETLGHRIAAMRDDGNPKWPDTAQVLDAVRIVEQAARTLHVTHESGIIHRDIKPGNIMVAESGEPVILDFGLARDESDEASTLTRTGDLFGTPAYMSPEQLAGSSVPVDRRTDVYSLGVTLFECLTLERPFDAPTRQALYQAIVTREPRSVRSLNPAIPRNLAVVVATAIEKDRNARYQTALDFAEELRRVRANEPILASPIGRLARLGRWARRNPGLATAVGGLILALSIGLGVALYLLAQRDRALLDKQAALSEYDRLGDLSRLQSLEAMAEDLWPWTPEKVPAMKSWIEHGADLASRLDGHREVLARLRGSKLASTAEQFKHDTTARLVTDLTAFADPDPQRGLLANLRHRLAFAESVRRETIEKPAERWSDAVRSIRDANACPAYRGLRIAPQLGLVPIGRDPKSGLWEFAHLQTTAPGVDPAPRRGSDGALVVTAETGLVLVLLPGGTFRMGADHGTDPEAYAREAPITEVTLDPFFVSKYEMTQGQWIRLAGRNPSLYVPGSTFGDRQTVLDASVLNLRNPVEELSWDDCKLWLERIGMALPTEAQWEYAARGGTTTPRWMGSGTGELAATVNLADAFCEQSGGPAGWRYEPWSDGWAIHAPVGSFAPNPFGLHEVLGNIGEWCQDELGSYESPARPGDGLRTGSATGLRVYRGGSFTTPAVHVRATVRYGLHPGFRHYNMGCRPVRRLDP
jgi:formylglycine-generating enzyme required for sulfatase activity